VSQFSADEFEVDLSSTELQGEGMAGKSNPLAPSGLRSRFGGVGYRIGIELGLPLFLEGGLCNLE
jgi:hypothetical protein